MRLASRMLTGGVGVMLMAGSVLAATGDVLLEYDSNSGKTPEAASGNVWFHEGRCLDRCPGDGLNTCAWNGLTSGNVCGTNPGQGCSTPIVDFNFTPEPQGLSGTCSYTEWLEFDDDGANLNHPNTCCSAKATPKGAANFDGAPGHEVLRIVTGDGNGADLSLPANTSSNRNSGKTKIKASHNTNGTVTVVFRGALAIKKTSSNTHSFLGQRAVPAAGNESVRWEFFHFTGNEGGAGSPCSTLTATDCGRFGIKNDQSGQTMLLTGIQSIHPVDPNNGETPATPFFVFRAILDPAAKTAEIWVNEDPAQHQLVTNAEFPGGFEVRSGDTSRQTMFGGINVGDETVWVDSIQVLEGAVGPPDVGPCDQFDPVFDQTGPSAKADGLVDQQDFSVFTACATGPTPAAGVFDALSQNCKCMDVTEDGAIDQEDFGIFQACFTGATGTLNTSCDD